MDVPLMVATMEVVAVPHLAAWEQQQSAHIENAMPLLISLIVLWSIISLALLSACAGRSATRHELLIDPLVFLSLGNPAHTCEQSMLGLNKHKAGVNLDLFKREHVCKQDALLNENSRPRPVCLHRDALPASCRSINEAIHVWRA
jgi:hypothetical protein